MGRTLLIFLWKSEHREGANGILKQPISSFSRANIQALLCLSESILMLSINTFQHTIQILFLHILLVEFKRLTGKFWDFKNLFCLKEIRTDCFPKENS